MCVYDEEIDDSTPIELFDPAHTWKRKTLSNYTAELLQTKIYENGKLVYELPNIHDIRRHCQNEIEGMWDEVKRFNNPHNYYVDLSQKLWDIKHNMIAEHRKTR